MPRKVKIEIVDDDGTKIRIETTKARLDKILNYLRILESVENNEADRSDFTGGSDSLVIDRVLSLIKNEFGVSSFTLSDLYMAYKLKYNEDISKSTLSTYLSRFVDNGMLVREGRRGGYRYRLAPQGIL